tara:strand:- start:1468 stop:1740 length:273 start_codon:yes stop_codon:yes gene_type:complete
MKNWAIKEGITYFKLRKDAEKIKDKLIDKEIYHFGNRIKAEPRIIEYQLGYAVQYIKSGGYYPENTTWQKKLLLKGSLFYLNDFKENNAN